MVFKSSIFVFGYQCFILIFVFLVAFTGILQKQYFCFPYLKWSLFHLKKPMHRTNAWSIESVNTHI